MASEPNYAAEMALPAGKTCADCRHIKRCTGFGFSAADETSCDFWPSRFVERKLAAVRVDAPVKTVGAA